MRGFLQHLLITLKLNFRNPMAIIMGYLLPIIFLLVFGAFLNSNTQRMADVMGQVLTISILGGACFGMPIAFVSERERGVWRRYKLTPAPTITFIFSILIARYVLVLSAGLMQLGLALWVGMKFPVHPWQLLLAFTV